MTLPKRTKPMTKTQATFAAVAANLDSFAEAADTDEQWYSWYGPEAVDFMERLEALRYSTAVRSNHALAMAIFELFREQEDHYFANNLIQEWFYHVNWFETNWFDCEGYDDEGDLIYALANPNNVQDLYDQMLAKWWWDFREKS
jgi:hypothetical protein